MAQDIALNPCPACQGSVRIFTHIARGAFAECGACGKEYDICGMNQIPTYKGVRIRKSTADKIRRMWNKMSATENKKEK